MKKLKLSFLFVFAIAGNTIHAQSSDIINRYIDQYKDFAVAEMIRTGVPASITLAQGIHETGAGTSKLVLSSNNHFGIKCKSEWKGEYVFHDDDAKGECFRKYSDPFESYRDHSDFLKNRPHYASLFDLSPTDYEGWAYGLKKAGYATNPKYPQILIRLIREYNLNEYTLIALNRKKDPNAAEWASAKSPLVTENTQSISALQKNSYPTGVFSINQVKVVFVENGTSFLKVAAENNISLPNLFEYNDMRPQDIADEDQLVFLQRKRKVGAKEFHIVAEGETVHSIAQQEGIRMENLLEYNHLKNGLSPWVGEKLYLTTKAPAVPRVTSAKNMITTSAYN